MRASPAALYSSWGLSEEYGFTDIDGARPHLGNYFSEHFPQFWNRKPRACFEWKLAPVAQEEKTERRRTAKAKQRKSESDAPSTGGKKREHAGSTLA